MIAFITGEINFMILEILILAIIQGLTEWLPISSSGHLTIAQKLLGFNPPLLFDVMLHFGTLVVVLIVFRIDILNIIKALAKADFKTEDGKIALFIVVGSIPIGILGFTFYEFLKSLFSNILAVGLALVFTGCFLFGSKKKLGHGRLGFIDSLFIGFAQAIALIPGISRSGLTISVGLLRKVDKDLAFRFSFLLSLPAILGATVFESKELVLGNIDVLLLFLGTVISMVIGYISLKFLQRIIMTERLHLFAYYCWIIGLLTISYSILG